MKAACMYYALCAGVLILSGYAGTIGTPFLVNQEVGHAVQPSDQYDHRVVSNNDDIWLVLWADTWTDEIYGMRLNSQGIPLDATALPIGPNSMGNITSERRYPVAVHFQDEFQVVWQEYRDGLRQGYGRRIRDDGTFPDPIAFSAESSSLSAFYSAVCAGETNLLMTWSGYSSGYRLWAQTWSPDGQPVGTSTQIMSGLSYYLQPSMAFGKFDTGTRSYLLAFAQNSDIWGKRVTESGVALDPVPFAICTNGGSQYGPQSVFGQGPGGTQGWWVVWSDTRNGNEDIYGTFISQAGVSGHSATGMGLIVNTQDQFDPSLCWDSARYLLGWHDYRTPAAVRAAVMDTSGILVDTNGTLVSTNEISRPIVCARSEGEFLAVHGFDHVYAETITASGTTLSVGTQQVVSVSGAYERYTSGSCDGSNYWVTFEYHPEEIERKGDIAIQRISPEGEPFSPTPLLVCTNIAEQWGPSLAAAKDTVLTVWTDERYNREQIWGQLTTLDGQLSGTNFQIGVSSLYAYFCDVASDGTNFLVVWEDAGTDKARGRFIQANGSMASSFDVGGYYLNDPSVTFGGNCYLVLWGDEESSTEYVRYRRFRSDGSAIDGVYSNLYDSEGSCWNPQAAYNPNNNQFLVTWRDQDTYQILGRTLDASTAAYGNVITALVINTWNSSENWAITYDGTDWLCLFQDKREGPASLYGARVQDDGTLLDTEPFLIISGGTFGDAAAPVSPCTNVLITGTHQVYDTPEHSYCTRKSMGIFWQPGAQPSAGQQIAGQNLAINSSGQMTLLFEQSAPNSTGYVVEACTSLIDQDWHNVTNCLFLDSGVGVSAQWNEQSVSDNPHIYRATGQ